MGIAVAAATVAAPLPIAPVEVAHAAWSQSKADKVINTGKRYLGRPYKFGASKNTTAVFDCSSFVQRVYKEALGKSLPRDSRSQSTKGTKIAKSNLKKGDLVFFKASTTTKSTRITHVAIYAGNNQLLHTYGKPGVTFTKFKGTNWEKRFVTARRVM